MTAAVYFLTAVLAAVMVMRARTLDRNDRVQRAFLGLGITLAVSHLSFALSFLPGLDFLRGLWTGVGVLVPAFLWRCVDRLFPPSRPDRLGERLLPLGVVVGPGAAVAHAVLFAGRPQSSPAEMVAGVFGYFALALVVHRLHEARAAATLPAVRIRITWLLRLVVASGVAALAEWVARATGPLPDPNSLAFFDRGLALHGALPPISTALAAAVLYMLHHALHAQRLVALQELLARLVVVLAAAVLLVAAHSVAVEYVALARFPLHSSYLLILVSAVFLSNFDALRGPVQRRVDRWFHQTGQELEEAVRVLQREIPTHIQLDPLAADTVDKLFATGRFTGVGCWLLDPGRGAYHRMAHVGFEHAPADVGGAPCPAPLEDGAAWYEATTALCHGLGADLLLPFRDPTDGSVHGWLAVRDAEWSDGFSDVERIRLRRVADAAGRALTNLATFRRSAEERRSAGLGVMSAGLAHEIRNPLAGIKGAAQLLQDEALSEEGREMIGVLLRETARLDRLVGSFLAFARPVHLDRSRVDLRSIAEHTVRLVRAEGLPADVRLDLVTPGAPVPVLGDEARIEQVVLNLVRNALDALGGRGNVAVRVADEGGDAVVEVRDDGPGIPPDVMDQLTTPFFTTKPEGTGLGLAISRRIAEAHGGRLEVRSRPGEGATFTLRLPPAPADPQSEPNRSPEGRGSRDGGSAPAPGTNRDSS